MKLIKSCTDTTCPAREHKMRGRNIHVALYRGQFTAFCKKHQRELETWSRFQKT